MNGQTPYSTSEFPLAIVFHYFGFMLEGIDKTNPRRSKFVFQHSPELDECAELYWKKALVVEPQAFFNASKEIKSRLYDGE